MQLVFSSRGALRTCWRSGQEGMAGRLLTPDSDMPSVIAVARVSPILGTRAAAPHSWSFKTSPNILPSYRLLTHRYLVNRTRLRDRSRSALTNFSADARRRRSPCPSRAFPDEVDSPARGRGHCCLWERGSLAWPLARRGGVRWQSCTCTLTSPCGSNSEGSFRGGHGKGEYGLTF